MMVTNYTLKSCNLQTTPLTKKQFDWVQTFSDHMYIYDIFYKLFNFTKALNMFFQKLPNQTSNETDIEPKFIKEIRSKTECASPPSSERSSKLKGSKAATDKKQTNFSDASFSSQNVGFISSIINKIKNVERSKPSVNSNAYAAMFCQEQKPLTKGFKRIKYTDDSNNKPFISPISIQQKNSNRNCLMRKYQEHNSNIQLEFSQIKKQNKQLKETINNLNLTISIMTEQHRNIQAQLKEKKFLISQLQANIEQKEVNFSNQIKSLQNSIKQLQNQNIQLQKYSGIDHSQFFTIGQTLDEVIFPSQNALLIKAQQDIRVLRVELINLQKKSFENINLLRKQKNQQISILRKAFHRNLNHYKETTVKQTLKQKLTTKNQIENRLQTTIEVCSAQES